MSSITYWRLYCSVPIGDRGENFVEISDHAAEALRKRMAEGPTIIPFSVVTGRVTDMATSRTIYVNPSHVVALEPRDD